MHIIKVCKSLCKHINYKHIALLFFLVICTLLMDITEGVIYFVYWNVNLKITPNWYFEKITWRCRFFVGCF